MRGKVAWFSAPKGFGFLTRDDGGADVFVYFDQIEATGYKTLDQGAVVEFDLGTSETNGKPMAVKVRQIGNGHGSSRNSARRIESH